MEVKPMVDVPDDVHLTYDGMHDYIKHEEHIVTPPPSILTPIVEEVECDCNEPNPDCKSCQKEAFNYALYLERINYNTNIKLKEVTDAYNKLRSNLPDTILSNYSDGLHHGMALGAVAITVLAAVSIPILKYFKRI
jgi:hypothetical protein